MSSLGRNHGLQGLASAIVKLWEKCVIAKVAIKWGALNTNNEAMADELKAILFFFFFSLLGANF